MSLTKAVVLDGQLVRFINLGDVLAGAEVFPATLATNALAVTGQILSAGFIQRTPTGAAADTIDNAGNIINAITAGLGAVGVQNGTTWRVKWHNNAAFVITVAATANTGVTVTQGTVNASSVKEFLVTVVNGTPAKAFNGITTNASAVITGVSTADCALLSPGMIVTNAVNGLQGTTIISVNVGGGTVTMSGNANATVTSPVTINASPVITLQGIGQGLL